MVSFEAKLKKNLVNFKTELKSVCRRYGRTFLEIKVVFVTKYLDLENFVTFINIARQLSIASLYIGENKVQEAEKKIKRVKKVCPNLRDDFKFIMVGHLQKNKINKAIKLFDEIHSVDSARLARDLNTRLAREGKTMPVFLEVNVSGEETKRGVKVEEVNKVIATMKQCNNLTTRGLMTMAPHFDNPEKTRPVFRQLKQLADKYNLLTSMGMSNDWKEAVEEGSDMIRIGSRIFNP